jgi:hypothetical protein
MFFIFIIHVPVGAGLWWICATAIPWLFRHMTLTNISMAGLASWGVASLLGKGDEFIGFFVDSTVTVVETVLRFFFNERDGYFWDACIFAVNMGFRILEIIDSTGVFEPVVTYSDAINSSIRWIEMLNQFFPIVEIGILSGIFIAFVFIFIIGKIILKLIPGIG